MNFEKEFEIAKKSALLAGELLSKNFLVDKQTQSKQAHDVTVKSDKEAEKLILENTQKEFPSHSIFSEEIGAIDKPTDYLWMIDPLDGTNNFAAGISYFSVSIALSYKNEIVLGVVYNPISNQFFSGLKDNGAYINDNPIKPSNTSDINKAILSFIKGHRTYADEKLKNESIQLAKYLKEHFRRTIDMWAPALDWCLLAAGGIDTLISFESELEDQYAGTLIAKEAGVKITDFEGNPYTNATSRIIASNENMSNKLVTLIADFKI